MKPERADPPAETSETTEEEATSALLDLVLAPSPARACIDGVLVGRLVSVDPPRVVFPGSDAEGVPARAMAGALEAGAEVALLFEAGDPARPIVLGAMAKAAPRSVPVQVEADGEAVEVNAKEQLVLRCGEASITLTKEGKILLRGVYISSRAVGVHRIQGGAVEIN